MTPEIVLYVVLKNSRDGLVFRKSIIRIDGSRISGFFSIIGIGHGWTFLGSDIPVHDQFRYWPSGCCQGRLLRRRFAGVPFF